MSKHLPVLGQAPAQDPGFPDLHRSTLDWDELDCVLADLDDFTAIVELQTRDSAGKVTAIADIVEGRDQLVAGSVIGLQVIYDFADQRWCDTLMRLESGVRLSRLLANPPSEAIECGR